MKKTIHNLITRINPYLVPIGVILLFVLLGVNGTLASYLGNWDQFITDLPGQGTANFSGEDMAIQYIKNLVRIFRYVIGGVALVMAVIYGLRLVFSQGKEEEFSKQRKNILWLFLGFIMLLISENMAQYIFNPESATTDKLINFNAAHDQLRDIANYLKWLLGSIIILAMLLSSVRMITSGGDEEVLTKQKRNFTWSLIGMLVILLASNIVNALYVVNSPTQVAAASPDVAIVEIASIVRLILVFTGPLAVLFTIYAGFMYLTALDNEERAKKGRTLIVTGIIGIIIIFASYTFVNTMINNNIIS